jgi:hypothetical protein
VYLQLFAQACGIDIILRSKLRTWATNSKGMYIKLIDGVKSNTFGRWSDLGTASDSESSIAWAQLKNPQRCVEKLYRAYNGDASRLVDLCRQTIVFDEMHDLVNCLEIILADEEVCVERVKNRMDVKYDIRTTAGYRFVVCVCVCVCVYCCVCIDGCEA